jgi:hypothetical protein
MCTHHQTALPAAIYLASRASVCGLTVHQRRTAPVPTAGSLAVYRTARREYSRDVGLAGDHGGHAAASPQEADPLPGGPGGLPGADKICHLRTSKSLGV